MPITLTPACLGPFVRADGMRCRAEIEDRVS